MSVLPANVQDRDGAHGLLQSARRRFPFITKIFADAGYQGPKMAHTVAATGRWKIEIVKRSDLKGFVVLPKRWIVERTFAWISRNRRLMRKGSETEKGSMTVQEAGKMGGETRKEELVPRHSDYDSLAVFG